MNTIAHVSSIVNTWLTIYKGVLEERSSSYISSPSLKKGGGVDAIDTNWRTQDCLHLTLIKHLVKRSGRHPKT